MRITNKKFEYIAKQAGFRLFAFLIGIFSILLVSELFFRINPRIGYKYALDNFVTNETKISDWPFLEPDDLLGYRHIPGFGPYGLAGNINAYGLVGREYQLQGKDTFRILALGDSIAEQGWSCEYLEDYLNGQGHRKFEIWNAAVAGYDIRRYALYLKHIGMRYKPDMVIIFFCLNDFDLNINVYYHTKNSTIGYYFGISEISKVFKVSPFLMSKSYLYRFVILRLDAYLVAKKNKENEFIPEQDGEYYLNIINGICKDNNIPLFAVIFPYLKPLSEYSDGEKYEYDTIRKVIKEFKIPYLNLYDAIPEEKLYGLRAVKNDHIHPSRQGHLLIAGLIYDFLYKQIFFK